VQNFVEGKKWCDTTRKVPKMERTRLNFLDLITGNTDRHSGNLMVDARGKVYAIDNGLSFADNKLLATPAGSAEGQSVRLAFKNVLSDQKVHSTLPKALRADAKKLLDNREAVDARLRDYLTESQRESLFRRAQVIHDNPKKFGEFSRWSGTGRDDFLRSLTP
jgi:hypothetical protein